LSIHLAHGLGDPASAPTSFLRECWAGTVWKASPSDIYGERREAQAALVVESTGATDMVLLTVGVVWRQAEVET
jgi:hypothetical protein